MALSDAKKGKLSDKYDPVNFFFVDAYHYDNWFENEESTDTTRKSDKEESDMSPLEGEEEEVREGKRLTVLPNY